MIHKFEVLMLQSLMHNYREVGIELECVSSLIIMLSFQKRWSLWRFLKAGNEREKKINRKKKWKRNIIQIIEVDFIENISKDEHFLWFTHAKF